MQVYRYALVVEGELTEMVDCSDVALGDAQLRRITAAYVAQFAEPGQAWRVVSQMMTRKGTLSYIAYSASWPNPDTLDVRLMGVA